MKQEQTHVPVLLDTFLNHVEPYEQIWVDATYGNGGYAKALVKNGVTKVIAFDCDPDAQKRYSNLPERLKDKILFVPDWFGSLDKNEIVCAHQPIDGVVFDLGVSSYQLIDETRGFSFIHHGPLDMRMDKRLSMTAADIINGYSEEELTQLLFVKGEERQATKISKRIVKERQKQTIKSTQELSRIIEETKLKKGHQKIHPATKTFMALRIEVNKELQQLESGLQAAERILKPDGVMAVVTFHSLEDRIVKFFFKPKSVSNRYLPEGQSSHQPFCLVNSKPLIASKKEQEINPRSRSAKLRIARKTRITEGFNGKNSLRMMGGLQ